MTRGERVDKEIGNERGGEEAKGKKNGGGTENSGLSLGADRRADGGSARAPVRVYYVVFDVNQCHITTTVYNMMKIFHIFTWNQYLQSTREDQAAR